jgi:protein-S-isoprenylcysteine O-methyltransferase Ste14
MLVRLFLQTSVWLVIMGSLLFVPAGTIAWPEAWIYLAIIGGVGSAAGLWFARNDPGLLRERMAAPFQAGQPAWDKAILALFFALYLGSFVVAGLDAVRWRTTVMPAWVETVGAACILASYAIIWRVLAENSFAAPVVRIQDERGQRIVTSGPYAIVRHPMYGGAILFLLGTPLLLGSTYGLVFVPLLVILLAVRSVFEERALANRFPDLTALRKEDHRRDAADAEGGGDLGNALGVELGEANRWLEVAGGRSELRRHGPTRAAPARPEVDENGNLGLSDHPVEGVGAAEFDRMAVEQRRVATPAVRQAACDQPRLRRPIEAAAFGTDGDKAFLHGFAPPRLGQASITFDAIASRILNYSSNHRDGPR